MQGDAKMNNNGQVKKWWVFKPVHNADAIRPVGCLHPQK